ncbi:MAG: MBL fold metallo-hydrolase, partial [Gammaproteobacteria bacterium]|nr:MBL fold metallo-hydrolase [Gammaproteobacteria bacterium]
MLSWQVGEVRITCIVETVWPVSPKFLFPQVDRERLGHMHWLKPHFVDEQNRMLLSIHALLIQSQGQCIMVDTCLGNDKQRDIEAWHMRSGPFLEQMRGA